METSKILQSDYLDLIFDNRNKTYGGYELRKHYNRRALKALGITMSVLILAIGGPLLLGKGEDNALYAGFNNKPPIETVLTPLEMPPPPKEMPKPIEKANPAPPAAAKTIINTIPKIVLPDVKPDINPPDPKDLKDALSGPVTNPGDHGDVVATSPDKHNGPFGNGPGSPEIKGGGGSGGGPSEPVRAPDEMPEYPGGMAALNKFVSQHVNYPYAAREENIQGKVLVKFVVDEQGAITDAKIVKGIGGGCDKEALRVINAMPRWKPGKVKGRAVKVYYMLPIAFTLN